MYFLTNIRTQTHNDYACVLLFIVGFFGVGMQVGMDKMFGPDTPLGPMMKYWTVKSDNPIATWAARMFGLMMIAFSLAQNFERIWMLILSNRCSSWSGF